MRPNNEEGQVTSHRRTIVPQSTMDIGARERQVEPRRLFVICKKSQGRPSPFLAL